MTNADQSPSGATPTTDDTLLGGKVIFRQPAEGYRAAIDPVLLAASVPDTVKGRVLDLGCGAGAAMLCLARRRGDLGVVGLERDAELAELARANIKSNEFAKRASVVAGDLLRPPASLALGSFDAVIANPPYHDPRDSDPSPDERKAAATVEGDADLIDWVRAASRLVKAKGVVLFIHRADRLGELRDALTRAGCGGLVTVPLWPKAGVPPKRIIVLARRGDPVSARAGEGLVLHEHGGRFTRQAEAILREAAPLTIR